MTSTAAHLLPGPPAATCCAPAIGEDPGLDADRLAAVAKALAEPLRVRIVDVLRRSPEPVCQCELIALFDIKQSLLSHHIRKLVAANLVDVERRHKWAYYSVPTGALAELAAWLGRVPTAVADLGAGGGALTAAGLIDIDVRAPHRAGEPAA